MGKIEKLDFEQNLVAKMLWCSGGMMKQIISTWIFMITKTGDICVLLWIFCAVLDPVWNF
jgi:hypothetical protein